MSVQNADINGSPTFISTFAGCGGSSLGYKWAGFRELLAIEWDKKIANIFKLNFPDISVIVKDIKEVTSEEIFKLCNIKLGELDLLDGSPPCQGFSTAGKRKVLDTRNDLFLEFKRLIVELQPKVFVMENVSGVAKGIMKGKFIEIMKELKSTNYNVKYKQLNAKFYNVPQSRERLIWIGVRKDLEKEPIFPKPTNKIITVKDAIGLNGHICSDLRSMSIKSVNNPSYTLRETNCFRVIKSDRRYGDKLLKSYQASPKLAKLDRIFLNKFEKITIEQAKKLCSFPEDFKLIGNYSQQWAALGNSVMPKFMEAIAKTIRGEILCR